MARLFDDIHNPLLRDLVATSEPDAVSEASEALVEYETARDCKDRIGSAHVCMDRRRHAHEERTARLIDLAHERGDLAAIAILEGPIFGYADRFISEGGRNVRS